LASVRRDRALDERIDGFLAYLIREWEATPALAEEWPEWSSSDRDAFALDWPVKEDRLMQLGALARDGRLSPEQVRRFRHVSELVAEHRPLLDRLFQEEGLPPSGARGAEPPPRPASTRAR